jgi:hypothetical protein
MEDTILGAIQATAAIVASHDGAGDDLLTIYERTVDSVTWDDICQPRDRGVSHEFVFGEEMFWGAASVVVHEAGYFKFAATGQRMTILPVTWPYIENLIALGPDSRRWWWLWRPCPALGPRARRGLSPSFDAPELAACRAARCRVLDWDADIQCLFAGINHMRFDHPALEQRVLRGLGVRNQ